MKRYLVTMTGRSNLILISLRDRDICDCYVYANNKTEAISKFWEQMENNKHLSGYSRRDWKITAERWEKGEIDIYGNPLSDLEGAIPFDLLSVAEMSSRNGYWILTAPETAPETEENEMNQPEPEKVTESTTEPQNSKSSHQVISRKVELIKSQKSEVLLMTFEQIARQNPIINEDLELLRAELLIRMSKEEV